MAGSERTTSATIFTRQIYSNKRDSNCVPDPSDSEDSDGELENKATRTYMQWPEGPILPSS